MKQIHYKPKQKICKQCGKEFLPYTPLTIVCSPNCAYEWNKEKNVKKRVKEMKKGLQTHSDYLNALQVVFNTYIRKRDAGKKCISCGCVIIGNGHASHFWSVGAYPNLRFDEDNVHLACISCNLHKHGNINEYALRLPERIGQQRFDELNKRRELSNKLSIPEIKILITKYKNKIK